MRFTSSSFRAETPNQSTSMLPRFDSPTRRTLTSRMSPPLHLPSEMFGISIQPEKAATRAQGPVTIDLASSIDQLAAQLLARPSITTVAVETDSPILEPRLTIRPHAPRPKPDGAISD